MHPRDRELHLGPVDGRRRERSGAAGGGERREVHGVTAPPRSRTAPEGLRASRRIHRMPWKTLGPFIGVSSTLGKDMLTTARHVSALG